MLPDVGIKQGRRAAMHVFGAMARTLSDSIKASSLGVGQCPPSTAIHGWQGIQREGPKEVGSPNRVWPEVQAAITDSLNGLVEYSAAASFGGTQATGPRCLVASSRFSSPVRGYLWATLR